MFRVAMFVAAALSSALVLSGCQRTPLTGSEALTGVITESWPGQAASLRLEAVTFSSATVLAEAPIGADGHFTMPLPGDQDVVDALTPVDAEALCALFGPDPTSTTEVTPSPLDVLYAEARVYASAAADAEPLGVLGYQADSAEGLISVILVYAASAGTVEGSCGSGELVFDLDLVAGWNEVAYTQSGNSITLKTGGLPDRLSWRFYATSGEPGSPVEPPPPVEPPEPTPPPPPPTPLTPKEISGTAEGWSDGQAIIRAEGTDLDNSRQSFVAERTISADGKFSLTLPAEEAELADVLFTADQELFCPEPGVSTVKITPGPFETVFVGNYFLVYDATEDELLGSISPDRLVPQNDFSYAYAPSDVSVKGECVTTYGDESSTLRLDLEYKAGWNAVFFTQRGPVLSVSTGLFPTDARWVYTDEFQVLPGPPSDPLSPSCDPEDLACPPPVTPALLLLDRR